MLRLRQVGIGISAIPERLQITPRPQEAELSACQRAVFALLFQHKRQRLLRVVLAVKLCDRRIRFPFEVAKLRLILALAIAPGDKIVPLINVLQRLLRNTLGCAHPSPPLVYVIANVYHPCLSTRKAFSLPFSNLILDPLAQARRASI